MAAKVLLAPSPPDFTIAASNYERQLIMAIQIGNYNFDGPHHSVNGLRNASGVYVILGGDGTTPWNVVDIGESGDVRARVETHDRAGSWKERRHTKLAAAVIYVTEQQRKAIEQELRVRFNPPCGDR